MPFTYTFGPVNAWQAGWLDANFTAAGLLGTLPCTVSGTNALTLTQIGGIPASTIAATQQQLLVSGIATGTNSGAVTAAVAGLGALAVYKDTPSGPVALTGGEIVSGNFFVLAYDAALSGWHLQTAPTSAAGTVTSVATGTGLTGGPITGSGTISLASIATLDILANITGGSAAPIPNTLSAILDAVLSSSQGAVISRGASLWGAATETSWVPALSFGGGSVGIAYSTQVGQQLALGFLTIAMFNIVLSSKGSSTGAAAISLPVAAGGGNRIGGGLLLNYNLGSAVTTVPWARIAASGTTAALVAQGTGAPAALVDTDFTGTDTIAGILAYFTG